MCHSEIDGLRIQLVSPEFSAGTFDASFCHSMGLVSSGLFWCLDCQEAGN